MTKKDYIAFARMIRVELYDLDWPTRNLIIMSIAKIFMKDSLKFNKAKFYRACEYGNE